MLLFIYLCILVLNIVAIYLVYRFLGTQLEKKEKWIFIIAGVAIIYLMVTAVYGLSTKDIDIGKAASTARNLITFAFVPVNRNFNFAIFSKIVSLFKRRKITN